MAAPCPTCIFVHFHSFVPSLLLHPSVSVHFLFHFPGLAFASLNGVVVVIVKRVCSDVVLFFVFRYTYNTCFHAHIAISPIKLNILVFFALNMKFVCDKRTQAKVRGQIDLWSCTAEGW